MSEVTPNEQPARQPAPSPVTIHIPPGKWTVTVKNGSGKELTSFPASGPLTAVMEVLPDAV